MSWKPTWDDGNIIIRRARKEHRCHGGYDKSAQQRTVCATPILRGSTYVEYTGESAAFSSGRHYHMRCAAEQGLIMIDPD